MDYRLRGGSYARWLYNRGTDAVVAISEGVRSDVGKGQRAARIELVPDDVVLPEAGAEQGDGGGKRHGLSAKQ